MPTLDEIKAKLSHLDGFASFGAKKEIKSLPEILREDEEFVMLVPGTMDGNIGVLAATDQRLIFVTKGMLWGGSVTDFSLRSIGSISSKTGLMFGTIKVVTSGASKDITKVDKRFMAAFVDAVHGLLSNLSSKTANTAPDETDLVHKLDQLAKMHSTGTLTEDEFAAAKARLISS